MSGNPWETLDYEVGMINHGIARLASAGSCLEDQNMATECIVLHTRVLASALMSRKGPPDDILLTNLIPEFNDSHPLVAALIQGFGDWRDPNSPSFQFNKLCVHATSNRVNYHNYSPALQRFLEPMSKLWDAIRRKRASPPTLSLQTFNGHASTATSQVVTSGWAT